MSYVTDKFDGRVVELLRGGGVGFMPSDTIYGLSAKALDREAVERIHKLKDRQAHKPFIILVSDTRILNMLSILEREVALANPYWPGGLTLICPAPDSPEWLHKGTQNLAVRVPANPELRQLLDKVGPLVSTSANIEGQEPADSVEKAQVIFGGRLDFYVDQGKISGLPSTLVQVVDGKLKVIRQGAVKIKP